MAFVGVGGDIAQLLNAAPGNGDGDGDGLGSLGDGSDDGGGGGAAILPPGFAVDFAAPAAPRSFALAPSRRALLVVDGAGHVKARKGWAAKLRAPLGLDWLLGAQQPMPYAYLVRPEVGGEWGLEPQLVRRLEFPERRALPYGIAEAADGRVGVGFYSTAGLELWQGADLEAKLTLHELSLKPALPVFDAAGNLWVPYTIADRLDEEGDGVLALWAYLPDGGRFEVFARRQFSHVRFPHSVHIDGEGRVFVAGVAGKWLWEDGQYGPELKPEFDGAAPHVRIDVYAVAAAAGEEAFDREQQARFCEQHGGDCRDGRPLPEVPEGHWRAEAGGPRFALAPLRSFAFPAPFFTCLWALFVLTGDGHAICSCYESDTLQVLRLGRARSEGGGGGSGGGGDDDAPAQNELGLREAWGPPEPAGGLALLRDDEAAVVRTIVRPMGVASVGGIQMDPSGRAFALLDKARGRIVGAPWPWRDGVAVVAAQAPMLPFDA